MRTPRPHGPGTRRRPLRQARLAGLPGGARLLLAAILVTGGSLLLVGPAASGGSGAPEWPQWGGPGRDFVVDVTAELADSWPAGGPPVLWERPLGEGHSTIVVDGDRLYTMYRPRPEGLGEGEWATEEVVVALDAATGETVWEHRYASDPENFRFGAGPHSTPLIVGDRLFAAGTNKQLHALDRQDGEVLWSHDLVAEYDAPPTLVRPAVQAGYAPSPLAWRDLVILPVGGEGQAVMAFRQEDGSVAWSAGDFLVAHASPILIDLDGREQLVVVGGRTVNGLDPDTGAILWSHPHDTDGDMNNSTPLWGPDDLLFVSSSYNGGSRLLRLERAADATAVEELWFSRRLRIMIGNGVRIGDMVLGTSGDFGPQIITALDLPSGEPLWSHRGFNRAFFLHLVGAGGPETGVTGPGATASSPADRREADATAVERGKLLIVDEDGDLALAVASRDGLEVLERATVLEGVAWTAPTLVGSTLYARDRRTIMALDLGGVEEKARATSSGPLAQRDAEITAGPFSTAPVIRKVDAQRAPGIRPSWTSRGPRNPTRALRDQRAARQGRHGRGVPGSRPQPPTRRGDQAPSPGAGCRRKAPRSFEA